MYSNTRFGDFPHYTPKGKWSSKDELFTGWMLTTYYNRNGLDLSGMGREMLQSFGYSTTVYPEFPWERLAGVLLIVTGTSLLSCLFPAMKALRLQPTEALRR